MALEQSRLFSKEAYVHPHQDYCKKEKILLDGINVSKKDKKEIKINKKEQKHVESDEEISSSDVNSDEENDNQKLNFHGYKIFRLVNIKLLEKIIKNSCQWNFENVLMIQAPQF